MKRLLSVLLVALALIGFSALGVHNILTERHQVQLQDIRLKSTDTKLKQLQLNYDILNKNLDNELKAKNQNQDQIKQLEDQRNELERQKQALEGQLQARLEQKQAQASKIASAASLAGTAYAADDPKMFIYLHESGNKTDAVNSIGACGLGQALPCSKMPCSLQDYACQDAYFTNYMIQRYGSWGKARAFWVVNRWW